MHRGRQGMDTLLTISTHERMRRGGENKGKISWRAQVCTRIDKTGSRMGIGGGVRAAGTRQPLEIIGPRIRDGSSREGETRCDIRSTITSIVSVGLRIRMGS